MADWISFVVAFGVVVPWLLVGACLLTKRAYEATNRRRRMRTDPIYREVEIQFRAELAEAGLDGRNIPVGSVLWWSSVVAAAGLLARYMGWLVSMRWLWSMSAPLIVLEIAAILVTAGCLNLTVVSYVQRLGARRKSSAGLGTDGDGGMDDLLRATEALSTQYDAIAEGDRRRAAAPAHRLHIGFGDEDPRKTLRIVKRDHGEP